MIAVSVIVPVGIGDDSWRELLIDLKNLSSSDELIFVTCEDQIQIKKNLVVSIKDANTDIVNFITKEYRLKCQVRWLKGEKGRAKQMNFGADHAENSYLWFLHCDSKLKKGSLERLKMHWEANTNTLFYFDLIFDQEASTLMTLNTLGVWVRSHFFHLPFGDQGFAMSKTIFVHLGGYSENAKYGEDHLLIWKALQSDIAVKSIGLPIYTSSRKYKKNGWARTTLSHLFYTYKQAIPEFYILLKKGRKPS